jgi:hypothetical protein
MDIAGVKVYTYNWCGAELDYIRERDIPANKLHAFNSWAIGRPQPIIEDVPDAIYMWDWQEFVDGESI